MKIGTVRKNPVNGFYEFYTGIPDDPWSSAFWPKEDAVKYAKEYIKMIGITDKPKKPAKPPIPDKFQQFFSENAAGI